MPESHDLKGLMKFLARAEWRPCFQEVLGDHVGPVPDAGDMEFDDLSSLIGEDWAMTLWGCAFEDFLTQEFEEVEGVNIVDEYLRRRGWNEPAQSKAYMKALRSSVMSLYEVSEIVPGKSLMARDLIRGGDLIPVSEGTATRTLKQWQRIAARIVPVLGKNIFAGGLLPLTPQAADAVTWWNETGRHYGARSPEVRQWMLDSNNYRLDYYSINRSQGAIVGQTHQYLPPTR